MAGLATEEPLVYLVYVYEGDYYHPYGLWHVFTNKERAIQAMLKDGEWPEDNYIEVWCDGERVEQIDAEDVLKAGEP